jgi:glycosyltransferase involved in cell wall biosynthesis
LLFATGDSTCPVPTRWARPSAAGTVDTGSATELHHVVHAYDEIIAWNADLVHDHTLVGPVYAGRYELPVVTTNHGPFEGELGDFYRAIGDTVPIIALSRPHATSAGDIPIAAVIHHGVDVDELPSGPGDGDYALFLGRMSATKGVHVAARVARAAGTPLRIAAKMREPAERAYFREAVEPLLGDGVEYLGEVSGQEKLELLAGATCLLNPLAWPEPFGMVMIESLACGTPVVATPCGSVPDLIDDGVTGFVRDSEDELAQALGQVQDLDRKMCRKVASDRFSSSGMVARHVELYRSIVGSEDPARRTRPA